MLKKKQNTRLVFVRHGESEKNVLKIKSSSVDKWPLTENGKKHAKNIADRLNGMGHFEIILSSPVLRARQTAEIISQKLGLPVVIEDLLKEYEPGRWNDIPREELERSYSDWSEYKKIKVGTKEHYDFKLGGAESRADVVKRIKKFIKKICKEYQGQNLLLVSHGGINGAIAQLLENADLKTFYEKEAISHDEIETFFVEC